MTTLTLETEPLIDQVAITDERLVVDLADGRSLSVPLGWYPRLIYASAEERQNWQIIGEGYAIEWLDLDEHIDIEGLLAGRRSGESQRSFERWLSTRNSSFDLGSATTLKQNILNQIAGQTITVSSKTNHFNALISGVIGSDNAQVSNNTFTQINNANTTELLQLIAKLKETATTFPAETQDAIVIDLEDIEAEVQKPEETRNPKKLKQRLTAILAAAGVAASGVAGVTDFANTAIDLGNKLGIELQLPGRP